MLEYQQLNIACLDNLRTTVKVIWTVTLIIKLI